MYYLYIIAWHIRLAESYSHELLCWMTVFDHAVCVLPSIAIETALLCYILNHWNSSYSYYHPFFVIIRAWIFVTSLNHNQYPHYSFHFLDALIFLPFKRVPLKKMVAHLLKHRINWYSVLPEIKVILVIPRHPEKYSSDVRAVLLTVQGGNVSQVDFTNQQKACSKWQKREFSDILITVWLNYGHEVLRFERQVFY